SGVRRNPESEGGDLAIGEFVGAERTERLRQCLVENAGEGAAVTKRRGGAGDANAVYRDPERWRMRQCHDRRSVSSAKGNWRSIFSNSARAASPISFIVIAVPRFAAMKAAFTAMLRMFPPGISRRASRSKSIPSTGAADGIEISQMRRRSRESGNGKLMTTRSRRRNAWSRCDFMLVARMAR